jgi:hypothetical protein
MAKRIIGVAKRIALVAHDKRKEELLQWAKQNREALSRHSLVATGTTGKVIEKELGLPNGSGDFLLGSAGSTAARQRCESIDPSGGGLEYHYRFQHHHGRFYHSVTPDE